MDRIFGGRGVRIKTLECPCLGISRSCTVSANYGDVWHNFGILCISSLMRLRRVCCPGGSGFHGEELNEGIITGLSCIFLSFTSVLCINRTHGTIIRRIGSSRFGAPCYMKPQVVRRLNASQSGRLSTSPVLLRLYSKHWRAYSCRFSKAVI